MLRLKPSSILGCHRTPQRSVLACSLGSLFHVPADGLPEGLPPCAAVPAAQGGNAAYEKGHHTL
jgi:hypothetical protein